MEKKYYFLIIATVLAIGMVYVIFYGYFDGTEVEVYFDNDAQEEEGSSEETNLVNEEICVQICGAVNKEGVFLVTEGTRVYELVELAGGVTEDAAIQAVNQARVVKDGEMIYFPTIDEYNDGSYNDSGDILVNINIASKEALMRLPGIGETKAMSIIKYREEAGPFSALEDIMKVEGIKEGLFDTIKDLITI